MPKQVYVRAHYRNAPRRSSVTCLSLVLGMLVLFSISFGGGFLVSHDANSLVIALISIGIIAVIMTWRRRRSIYQESAPIVQSRYIPEHIRRFVMERDSYRCRSCGSNLYPEIDHIIPLARGGTNDPSNLQVLCRGCNAQKGSNY